ncbi:unnamed protein product [Paramecium octaurelia]|uniref:Deoxyuridine 5'-triphosphate nucleotidohydrolase n=1 Tax=Paramecium octaurelia TaxID=43137 RepID=A0A8S1WK89_PAROT|nr:unnamed protein product [Paramecium octaurelia]
MIYVKRLVEKAILPKKGSLKAAGYDLFSAEDSVVPAKGKQVIKTGISMALLEGTYGRIAPRSGLAAKNFIDVGAGVIDEDYRGEICVLLFNFGDNDFKVNYGDRIAQMVIEYVVQTDIQETDNLTETQRGEGGFGSTGVKLIQNTNNQSQQLKQKLQNIQQLNHDQPEPWQELTILDLYSLFSNGHINSKQKQQLGEITLKGDKKVYELFKKNEGKNEQIIIQQLLNLIEE